MHAERVAERPELFQPEVLQRLVASREVRGWEYVRALARREVLSRRFARLFERCDVLLMPTVPVCAPALYARTLFLDGAPAAFATHCSALPAYGICWGCRRSLSRAGGWMDSCGMSADRGERAGSVADRHGTAAPGRRA